MVWKSFYLEDIRALPTTVTLARDVSVIRILVAFMVAVSR